MRAHSQEISITPCVTEAPENAVVDGPVVDWQALCGELVLDIAFVVSWYALVVAIVKRESYKLRKSDRRERERELLLALS
jgi:hypothetical protein